MKILLLDIETAPNLAYVWRFFKETVGVDQVVQPSYIMSFAAKWLDNDLIYYEDAFKQKERTVLKKLLYLLDEADFVVAHNGRRFDLPKIKGRALVEGLDIPSPYKVIDTYDIARKEFGFESNSLAYLAKVLDCEEKSSHKEFPGFQLWLECLRKNPEAWKELKLYNIQDVYTLQDIYLKIRPYASQHPSIAVTQNSEDILCPKCGSDDNERRGFYYTNVGKFQRYRCKSCGGWHRTRYTENSTEVRKALTTNAV